MLAPVTPFIWKLYVVPAVRPVATAEIAVVAEVAYVPALTVPTVPPTQLVSALVL